MLKELPCLKEGKECKVNVVYGGEGWRTPENTWMDMKEVEEEVFFVNVLQEIWLDSDEELEREIEKMEVAVDDCIRRRTRRAGVSVARPEGERMSEAERDLVCEKLGDEPGTWAKRRREIEEMSEEDVLAEIKRMQAA